jgi:hypothetical protein
MPNQVLTESASADAKASGRVLTLIHEYRRLGEKAIDGLKKLCYGADPLRAWHSGRLNKTGTLTEPVARYDFHGVGCRFQIGELVVDLDFGPDERHDGFDAWRLWLLANSGVTPKLDLHLIERGLRALEQEHVIEKLANAPADPLYYLCDPKPILA